MASPEINKSFIEKYSGIAMEQQAKYGIPASVTLAQGILESSAGTSSLCQKTNNLFGVKVSPSWLAQGGEYVIAYDDNPDDKFCKLKSYEDSFENHSQFLVNNQRYKDCFSLPVSDAAGWCDALQKAGYATDKDYATKLKGIIDTYNLTQYDTMAMRNPEQGRSVAQPAVQGPQLSLPIDCEEFVNVRLPYGQVRSAEDPQQTEHHATLDLFTSGKPVLATESGGTVMSVRNGNEVTVQYPQQDGGNILVTYSNLDSVSVKQGDRLSAGQQVGRSSDFVSMAVRVSTTQGAQRTIDPAAYIASIMDRTGQSRQMYYNGTDILASYSQKPVQAEQLTFDQMAQKLLSSEDAGFGLGDELGSDPIVGLLVKLFTSLMALVTASESENRPQQLAEAVQNKSVPLDGFLPKGYTGSLDFSGRGPVLVASDGKNTITHPLSIIEQNRMSLIVGNTALSEQDRQTRVGTFLSGLIVQDQLSRNFDVALDAAQSQQRTEGMHL